MGYSTEEIRRRALPLLFVVIAVFALVEPILSEFFDIPENWFLVPIFLGIVAILEMITRTREKITKFDNDIMQLEGRFEEVINGVGWCKVTRYPDQDGFYEDLESAVKNASNSLYLTHIRHNPPEAFTSESAEEYFDQVAQWCEEDTASRQARRVTAVPNQAMEDWVKQELLKRAKNDKQIPNFDVALCEWNVSFPSINFAIVDEKEVYVALTAESPEDTQGIHIEDEEISKYFKEYFQNLWYKSSRLSDLSRDEIDDIGN